MSAASLQLYGNSYCHLCTEMLQALEPWRKRYGFEIEVIDIEGDAVLEARFGERIPVLMCDGEEVCHYFLDAEAVVARLEHAGIGAGAEDR